ncbi:MAG: hypothetical protein KGY54_12270 [Oleiphilaceae bacterium]|nr:hypothetical protein [Oleiphilaceae bacterium]
MNKRLLTAGCLAIAVLTTPALTAQEKSPYLESHGSRITLSGTVTETLSESFILDYGKATVTVNVADWKWYRENNELIQNDKVTVHGRVDEKTYETAVIDAKSLYLEDLGTYFYSETVEDDKVFSDFAKAPKTPIAVGDITITGTITSIEGRTFTIDSGTRQMAVDTSELPHNPLDDRGFQRLNVGDAVAVAGTLDSDTFEGAKMVADTIVSLDRGVGGADF